MNKFGQIMIFLTVFLIRLFRGSGWWAAKLEDCGKIEKTIA